MSNTAINWILKSSLSFIRDGDSSFTTVTHRKVSKELWNITCSKNLMNGCKMSGTLFMAKVRSKNTTSHTLSSQEFAGSTRRTSHVGIFWLRGLWSFRIFGCFLGLFNLVQIIIIYHHLYMHHMKRKWWIRGRNI